MLRICIGYDPKEAIAFQVLAHSILARASRPVSIIPIVKAQLAGFYTRPRGASESTDFSLTRFLAPWLCGYRGLGIFMDCDMLCLADIFDVLNARSASDAAIWVCQHDYLPKPGVKFLGQAQTTYPKKNWSSFMVFDAERCRALTTDYVNKASGLDLHRFNWLKDESLVGSLPLEWNWLVGEYPPNHDAKVLHYTLGTPCFDAYKNCDHADAWHVELAAMMQPLKTMQLARL